MTLQRIGVSLTMGLLLSGCLFDTLGKGDFVGVIVNNSSYTLNIDDPLDANKYFHLKPGEETKRYALDDKEYTFKAYYASDGKPYVSVSVRINSVKDDAPVGNRTYDWAVIFKDSSWLSYAVAYYE